MKSLLLVLLLTSVCGCAAPRAGALYVRAHLAPLPPQTVRESIHVEPFYFMSDPSFQLKCHSPASAGKIVAWYRSELARKGFAEPYGPPFDKQIPIFVRTNDWFRDEFAINIDSENPSSDCTEFRITFTTRNVFEWPGAVINGVLAHLVPPRSDQPWTFLFISF